jgi:hypothetical protein
MNSKKLSEDYRLLCVHRFNLHCYPVWRPNLDTMKCDIVLVDYTWIMS